MDTIKSITTRHSVRKYSDRQVEKEVLQRIVETARWAPSWKNTQTTRYIAVMNPELKQRIADEAVLGFKYNQITIGRAPVLIVETTVTGCSGYEKDGSASTPQGSHWQSFDAGIAANSFVLAAFEEGLGCVIMGIYDEKIVKDILNIPDNQSISALIGVGYPEGEVKGPKRKEVEELLCFSE